MSHLNLPSRIHEKPIEDSFYEICGVRIPFHAEPFGWDGVFKRKEDDLHIKASKALAKWMNTNYEAEKPIQNNFWPDYSPRQAEVEMLLKSKQGLTIEHGGITIYSLI
jgi:hypothetical protein